MSNSTAEKKKLQGVFALWRRKSQNGNVYFSGKTEGGSNLIGFYNTDKKNLKEPDLRVYAKDTEGGLSKDPFVSLWVNATNSGKKLLSGKLEGKKLIGFINASADEKNPYISVYYSEDDQKEDDQKEDDQKEDDQKEVSNKKDSKPEEKKAKANKKKEAPKYEEIPSDENLPF